MVNFTFSEPLSDVLGIWDCFLLLNVYETHFGCDCKETYAQENYIPLYLLLGYLKKRLPRGCNILNSYWLHMHHASYIKLLNPLLWLLNSQDWSVFYEFLIVFPIIEALSEVFFVVFRILLPIIEGFSCLAKLRDFSVFKWTNYLLYLSQNWLSLLD